MRVLDVKIIALEEIEGRLDRKANELNSLRNQLKVLVERCSGDHQPDCPILDALADRTKLIWVKRYTALVTGIVSVHRS